MKLHDDFCDQAAKIILKITPKTQSMHASALQSTQNNP
jgi:hypothetical protein